MQAIYQIKNRINGNSYVGSSVNFKVRKAEHLRDLRVNEHHSIALQRAFNKYGKDSFDFIVLEIVRDKKDLIKREQFYIDTIKPEYNCCKIASSMLGFKMSPESVLKNKLRNTGFGNGNAKLTQGDVEKIRELTNIKSDKELSELFNVHRSTIEKARKRCGITKSVKIITEQAKQNKINGMKHNYKARCKAVYTIGSNGEKIEFESIAQAARSVNRTTSTLHQAIREGRPCNGVMFYL